MHQFRSNGFETLHEENRREAAPRHLVPRCSRRCLSRRSPPASPPAAHRSSAAASSPPAGCLSPVYPAILALAHSASPNSLRAPSYSLLMPLTRLCSATIFVTYVTDLMAMAQHFLLSSKARTLSLRDIYKGGEEAARATFRKLRWPETDGEPVCPVCGSRGPLRDDAPPLQMRGLRGAILGNVGHDPAFAQAVLRGLARGDLPCRERGQGPFGFAACARSRDQSEVRFRPGAQNQGSAGARNGRAEAVPAKSRLTALTSAVTSALRTARKTVRTVALPRTRPASAASWWRSGSARAAR